MSYTHLTEHERVCIFHCQGVVHQAELARRLQRHPATLRRELKRFRRHPIWPYYHHYLPDHAHRFAQQQRCRKRGFRWSQHRPLLSYVQQKLQQKWSPEQIAERLPLDHPDDPLMRVSHSSIYRWLRADRQAGGEFWKHLRQSSKKRRQAYGSGPRRSRIPARVSLAQRPAPANERSEIGHWESDTVLGVHGRLATHVDRRSRYTLIARLPDGTAAAFNAGSLRCFKKVPARYRKTLTADNGSEFMEHQTLAARLGFQTYFADPYSSWQRGTNENTNGLIRQYLPKGSDFSKLSHQRVAIIEKAINNRPRKCLGYRSPAEVAGPALRLKC
jgi:transposase, IS30 family